MLYDVPVIVSKQSGVSEVLHNVVKIDFWDVQKLASCMIDILTNTDVAKKAVENNQIELKSIDWDESARKVISTYRKTVG